MKHVRQILMAVMIFFLGGGAAAEAHVSVLLYHKFDEADSPSTSISSAEFSRQMAYLKEHDYRVLCLRELEDILCGRQAMPSRGVVITIDDGYRSVYEKAFPVLKAYDYPFSVFVFTRAIGEKHFVSWDQLREMERHKGEVGSHSHTHPRLVNISQSEAVREMRLSKEILEQGLGHAVRWFSYPFGEYDGSVLEAVSHLGYTLGLTSDPGNTGGWAEPGRVPRQAIVGRDITMDTFVAKLISPPLMIVRREPAYGRLTSGTLEHIRLTLANPHLYLSGQVQMFLSERGRLPAVFDPETGVLSSEGPIALTRKVNRIIVTARRREDRLYAWDSFMVVLPESAPQQ